MPILARGKGGGPRRFTAIVLNVFEKAVWRACGSGTPIAR